MGRIREEIKDLFPIPDFWQYVGVVFSSSNESFQKFEEMKQEKLEKFMPGMEEVIKEIIDFNSKLGIKMDMPNKNQNQEIMVPMK